ncbi:hypothetical protein Val02_09260 [Virgisporangium aliadipatigenens]|uniref:Uncharacterized protein n=1 Tax=Virgisporangium aliadipatigenens TaxID=741659 RepID=A0A8J3YHE5_9ACTN|nr:beta-1,3-glucanase family protein [Virgisporangium aliadipatigenens]GIJ44040.1 hypothetical protein Val02_09260 [Virgisporangium aliadipatigenens]
MPKRRTVLGLTGIGAAALTVPFLASRADAGPGLPVTVRNSTGRFANSAIRMYIVGTELSSGRQGYVRDSGVFTPAGGSGPVDFGVPIGSNFLLPPMSGRIYFAIEKPLHFALVADGAGRPAVQHPAGWVAGDPNHEVLHDFVEFTYDGKGMYCNTTTVDMFSIPMALRLSGSRDLATGKMVDGGRDAVFAAVAKQPGFERLIVGDRLRIVAPSHGIRAGRFAGDYFDAYIDEIWDRYSRIDLRIAANGRTHTGRVQGGQLRFDSGVAFQKPSTSDVLFCDGALAAPNDGVTGPVAAILAAGFHRAVLDQPEQPATTRFYQRPVANHYARVMHEFAADRKAYGFAFDDVAGAASYIQDAAARGLEITLTPFGSGKVAAPAAAAPPPPEQVAAAAGAGVAARQELRVERATAQSGVRIEPSVEGGLHFGSISNGDWIGFGRVDFGEATATQFFVRAASGAPTGVSGLIEVRVDRRDSAPVGTIAVASTGGWQAWRTIPGQISPVRGVHDVWLTFTSGQPLEYVNVASLRFG